MSYQIGQFKRTDLALEDYKGEQSIPYTVETIETIYNKNSQIEDGVLVLKEGTFKAGEVYDMVVGLQYYIGDTVSLSNFRGNIQIKLSDGKDNGKRQIIKNEFMSGNSRPTISLCFMPQYDDFNSIIFEITRTGDNINCQGTFKPLESKKALNQLTNVLTTLGLSKVKKIGIQGPSGLKFIINGSLIKLGKNGMFMSKEMDINSICFNLDSNSYVEYIDEEVITRTNNDMFFIMDYQY